METAFCPARATAWHQAQYFYQINREQDISMADYIPSPDNDFNNWQINFLSYLQTNKAELKVNNEDIATLIATQSGWETSYEAHLNAQAAAQSARQQKNEDRQAWENEIRSQVRKLQASDTITNAHRAALGITVPESNRTPISVPTTRPIVIIAESKPLSHTVRFFDETTPNRRAKPAGVMGAEVWVKIGDAPPTNTDELRFFGLDTRTPYISKFDSEDAGKIAYYRLRWVNPKGKPGPWSDIVNAPIMP